MVKSMIVKDGIRMEFFKVQIPYRGVVPIINRKGPMACVELTRDQINELKSYGVELLNPDNGKKFLFPEQQPVEITLKDFANARPVTKAQLEVKAEPIEAPKEEVSAEPEAAEFDYTKVSGYSSLSKSKKKEIRSLFKHKMNSGMSTDDAYAELNAMIAEL